MKCSKCETRLACTDQFCGNCGMKQDVQKNLIMAAMNKDQLAYTELFKQAEHTVKLTVYSIMNPNGHNSADADDVILDSMMKGFQSLEQLNDANRYLPWMRTIARNKAIDYLRKNKEVNFSDLSTDEMDFEDTLEDMDFSKRPDMAIDQKAKGNLLKEILSDIPAEQRTVLVMYFYNDMKIHDIARELGCTEATVKSRLKYGKAKVKTGVDELQQKHGIKLYSVSPLVLFYWLFRDTEASYVCKTGILDQILHGCGSVVAHASSVTKATATIAKSDVTSKTSATIAKSEVTSKTAATIAKSEVTSKVVATAATATTTAAKGVSVKLVTSIIIATVATTGVVGVGVHTLMDKNTEQTSVSADVDPEDHDSDDLNMEDDNQDSNLDSSEDSNVDSSEDSNVDSSEDSNVDSSVDGSEDSNIDNNTETNSESDAGTSSQSLADQLGLSEETRNILSYQYENLCGGFKTRKEYVEEMSGFGVTVEEALKITEQNGIENLYGVDRIETLDEFYDALLVEIGFDTTIYQNPSPADFQEVYYDCNGDAELKIQDQGEGNYSIEMGIYRERYLGVFEGHIEDDKLVFSVGEGREAWHGAIIKREDDSVDVHIRYFKEQFSEECFVIYHYSTTEDFEGDFVTYVAPQFS